ncbi:hypothetical protein L1887_59624 [Cichorium endivia]|nr:hypothetical protein L1887_59624 [Cichorium endivia]
MSAGSSADLASVGAAVLAAADAALLDDDEVAFVGAADAADAADAASAAGAVSVDVIPSSGVRRKMEVSGSPRRAAKAKKGPLCCFGVEAVLDTVRTGRASSLCSCVLRLRLDKQPHSSGQGWQHTTTTTTTTATFKNDRHRTPLGARRAVLALPPLRCHLPRLVGRDARCSSRVVIAHVSDPVQRRLLQCHGCLPCACLVQRPRRLGAFGGDRAQHARTRPYRTPHPAQPEPLFSVTSSSSTRATFQCGTTGQNILLYARELEQRPGGTRKRAACRARLARQPRARQHEELPGLAASSHRRGCPRRPGERAAV